MLAVGHFFVSKAFVIGVTLSVTSESTFASLAADISGVSDQLPYAMSRAANAVVNRAQQAIQGSLEDKFTLRRGTFIRNTIYRNPQTDFANKSQSPIQATVRVDPSRDYLAKFETDTSKSAQSGGSLAVPIVRESDKSMIIQRSSPLYIKTVMALIAGQGGKNVGPFRRGKRGRQLQQQSFFLLKSRVGETLVMQRLGPGQARVLYAFRKSVPIKADLDFVEIAEEVVLNEWDAEASRALADAIATMK